MLALRSIRKFPINLARYASTSHGHEHFDPTVGGPNGCGLPAWEWDPKWDPKGTGSGRDDGYHRHDPRDHANPSLWKNISMFVALPAVVITSIYAYMCEKEHMSHPEHTRPPFVAYEYLRRRTKPFPWGDGNHSLFHNPRTNALPDGYETELPSHDDAGHGHH